MLGVLADDFSGAAEVAGLAVEAGLTARLQTHAAPALPRPDLVVIDTDTRSLPADEAARVAVAALSLLRRAGVERVFKKVDSVLRGPVAAELGALRDAGGYHHVVLLPANPSRARVIRHGRYRVDGVPLHEAVFAADPEHPVRTDSVAAILAAAGPDLAFASDPLAERAAGRILVAEAESAADVERWAGRLGPEALPAGAADFFRAWLARVAPAPGAPARVGGPLPPGTAAHRFGDLFVCGSAAAWSAGRAVDCARHGIPIVRLPLAPDPHDPAWAAVAAATAADVAARLRMTGRAMLAIAGDEPGAARALEADGWTPRLRVERLADVVDRLLAAGRPVGAPADRPRIDRMFVEGGMTAAAVARRLGWTTFTALPQLAPGITPLAVVGCDAPLFVPKPGSYPWPFGAAEAGLGRPSRA